MACKKYERIGQLMIRPLVLRGDQSAYDLARLYYAQYTTLDFDKDLEDYMRNGFVITRPDLFVLFKPIEYKGERSWFVRCLIGNLIHAVLCMPFMLPWLVFQRNNDPNTLVRCDTKRLIEVATMRARSKTNGRD